MNYSSVDLNPQLISDPSTSKGLAHQQLENACRQQIYAACVRESNLQENSTALSEDKGLMAALFAQCEWTVSTNADRNTLAIRCPNLSSNLLVFEKVVRCASALKPFAINKVRVSSSTNQGNALEVGVDELSLNRDGF